MNDLTDENKDVYEGEEDFYGEDESETDADVRGISGNVSSYTYTNLNYPCIIFKKGFSCPKHQLLVISNMVKSSGVDKDISLYFSKEDDLYKIGTIGGKQVSAFLEIVGTESVYGYFNKDIKLEDDRLYTLCTIF